MKTKIIRPYVFLVLALSLALSLSSRSVFAAETTLPDGASLYE
jgi:hypothetical protein